MAQLLIVIAGVALLVAAYVLLNRRAARVSGGPADARRRYGASGSLLASDQKDTNAFVDGYRGQRYDELGGTADRRGNTAGF